MKDPREKMRRREPTDEEALAAERGRRRAAAQEAERRKVVKALEKEVAEMGARHDFIQVLEDAEPAPPLEVPVEKGRRTGHQAAAYVMLASDWHVGERVRPENVGGRNEYNPDIAQERAAQFFKSQLKMLGAARAAWDIKVGVLWLGGDLMTGYIHEEYLEENFLSPVEEALVAHTILEAGIKLLLEQGDFERILIPTSNGNHGRTGQKMKVASSARNSFEWLLYQMLSRRFADEPRLEWRIGTGYHNVVDLYGLRVRFHHGDAIGYAGGIGGLSIPVNRRIGRQAAGVPIRWEGTARGAAHLDVFGHFHTLTYPGPFIGNGSLIGWNDFADRIGAPYQDPQQCSFVVDERYKVVSSFNPILVTKGKRR